MYKEKMESILDSVLQGEPFVDIYKVEIVNDNEFRVLKNGQQILWRQTVNRIENHWRTEVVEAIKDIIQMKIQKALSRI